MSKPIIINIASFSFSVDRVEEVGMAKIFTSPVGKKPDAFSVTWSEWQTDDEGINIQAQVESQIQVTRNIKKFEKGDKTIGETYELARQFFIEKVEKISKSYVESFR